MTTVYCTYPHFLWYILGYHYAFKSYQCKWIFFETFS